MLPIKYRVFAYKSDSTEYSRGCRMGSNPSDFEMFSAKNEDELLAGLARIYKRDINKDYGEDIYQISILKEGVLICENNNVLSYYDEEDSYTEIPESEREYIMRVTERAFKIAEEDVRLAKEQQERQAAFIKSLDADEEKRKRLKQYEELKREFGE